MDPPAERHPAKEVPAGARGVGERHGGEFGAHGQVEGATAVEIPVEARTEVGTRTVTDPRPDAEDGTPGLLCDRCERLLVLVDEGREQPWTVPSGEGDPHVDAHREAREEALVYHGVAERGAHIGGHHARKLEPDGEASEAQGVTAPGARTSGEAEGKVQRSTAGGGSGSVLHGRREVDGRGHCGVEWMRGIRGRVQVAGARGRGEGTPGGTGANRDGRVHRGATGHGRRRDEGSTVDGAVAQVYPRGGMSADADRIARAALLLLESHDMEGFLATLPPPTEALSSEGVARSWALPSPLRVSLGPEKFSKKLVKLFKGELQTGDEAFDAAVFIDTDTPQLAAAWLDIPALRSALLSLVEKGGSIEVDGETVTLRAPREAFDDRSTATILAHVEAVAHPPEP